MEVKPQSKIGFVVALFAVALASSFTTYLIMGGVAEETAREMKEEISVPPPVVVEAVPEIESKPVEVENDHHRILVNMDFPVVDAAPDRGTADEVRQAKEILAGDYKKILGYGGFTFDTEFKRLWVRRLAGWDAEIWSIEYHAITGKTCIPGYLTIAREPNERAFSILGHGVMSGFASEKEMVDAQEKLFEEYQITW